MDKKEIRTKYKNKRANLSAVERSLENDKIKEALIHSKEFINAEAVFIYVSCGTEADTLGIIEYCLKINKITAVPKIDGKNMMFLKINKNTAYNKNKYGILEPDSNEVLCPYDFNQVLIVFPGLCFDKELHRIGYGGGYYDRYMERYQFTSVKSAAIAFDCQLSEETIPAEAHDFCPELLILPSGTYRRY